MSIHGTSASPGLRSGRAYIYRVPEIRVVERSVSSIDDELRRLQSALEKSIGELEIIRQNIEGTMGEEYSHIFASHQTMIEDEEFVGEIKIKIRSEMKCCEIALQEVFDQYKAMFSELADGDYNKERLTDLADVHARIQRNILGIREVNLSSVPANSIVIAVELLPSDTALMAREKVNGIITERGGVTSHVAILAKNMRIPAIVGVEAVLTQFEENDEIYIDCREFEKGLIYRNPDAATKMKLDAEITVLEKRTQGLLSSKNREPITMDGKKILVSANIGSRSDFRLAREYGIKSIGLLRTEFFFLSREVSSYSEESQFEFYRELAEELNPGMLLIRTLDIGGDKDVTLFNIAQEDNPFLGVRGIRPCLAHPEIFKLQIRAILRASAFGNIKVMFPMITDILEVRKIDELFAVCKRELRDEGKDVGKTIETGIMVETPAAVLMADVLTRYTDFISLGTNDLTQYVLAADRTNEHVGQYYQQFHPSVFRAVRMAAGAAHKNKKWVGVCGELGGIQLAIPLLIGLGVDELSMAPQLQPEAVELIKTLSFHECETLAERALTLEDDASVRKLLRTWR